MNDEQLAQILGPLDLKDFVVGVIVSTVSIHPDSGIFYETMIFDANKGSASNELYSDRYTDRIEAIDAHNELVSTILVSGWPMKEAQNIDLIKPGGQ